MEIMDSPEFVFLGNKKHEKKSTSKLQKFKKPLNYHNATHC
ncbi:hypothetical protein DDB_G0281885 [Dictyostelium discoideum AX4]|nr:hypothetical protein DDB_G0281885 [Dictyostelium discoideum AX4]EAL66502.1 hypothetical protein DDB_G0281885 [Dictyostelium discoideum AX4]|eukprot:XP_640480.1 hypothetical protein DDB_G0281885 [Dictyostelium discoideum AX4]